MKVFVDDQLHKDPTKTNSIPKGFCPCFADQRGLSNVDELPLSFFEWVCEKSNHKHALYKKHPVQLGLAQSLRLSFCVGAGAKAE